jgi:hypothetical protein
MSPYRSNLRQRLKGEKKRLIYFMFTQKYSPPSLVKVRASAMKAADELNVSIETWKIGKLVSPHPDRVKAMSNYIPHIPSPNPANDMTPLASEQSSIRAQRPHQTSHYHPHSNAPS